MGSHIRQFLKLGTLLHFGTLSQICPTDPCLPRIQKGWVTYQGKPKLPPGQLPDVQSTPKILLNMDPELNSIIRLHVHRVNKAESVSAWSFSAEHQRKWIHAFAQASWVVRRVIC